MCFREAKKITRSRPLLQFEECRFKFMQLPLMRLYNMIPWYDLIDHLVNKHAKTYVNIWLLNIIAAIYISTIVCVAHQ